MSVGEVSEKRTELEEVEEDDEEEEEDVEDKDDELLEELTAAESDDAVNGIFRDIQRHKCALFGKSMKEEGLDFTAEGKACTQCQTGKPHKINQISSLNAPNPERTKIRDAFQNENAHCLNSQLLGHCFVCLKCDCSHHVSCSITQLVLQTLRSLCTDYSFLFQQCVFLCMQPSEKEYAGN